MPARRPILARLLAAIVLAQVVLAPAHCLAMAAAPPGFATVLCTAEGYRTIHLGPDGRALPGDGMAPGFCAACHALPDVALPVAPMPPTPAWAARPTAWHVTAPEALGPPARAPPFAPRAPPAFG